MKNLTTLAKVHFCILVFLILFNAFGAVMFIGGIGFSLTGVDRLHMLLRGILNLVNIIALIFAIVYLLNSYGKQSAVYYKAFLFLIILETVFLFALDLAFWPTDVLLVVSLVILGIKAVVLAVLVFWKNLGAQKTWLIYHMLLPLDVVGTVIMFFKVPQGTLVYVILAALSRLALDGAIGLAIRGKFADKLKRGRKV